MTARETTRAGRKLGLSDLVVPYGRAITQRIKATLGITGLSPPRVHIDGEVWHLDVGSSHPGAEVGPKGSFYPLSDGPSMRRHQITKPDFRPCSRCISRSQAPLYLYTLRMISNHSEGTFGRLRYLLGGDRPSQTARQTLSPIGITYLG